MRVGFDPGHRRDRRSHVARGRLHVEFADSPRAADALELSGDVEFPNLVLSAASLDFGCVLPDTLHRRTVTLTNPGRARVDFEWEWQQRADGGAAAAAGAGAGDNERAGGGAAAAAAGAAGSGTAALLASALRGSSKTFAAAGGAGTGGTPAGSVGAPSSKAAPMRPAFDILPTRGSLGPGEAVDVEVSFYAHPNARAAAAAACRVAGGPDAPLALAGESGGARFAVEPQFFDLGLAPYDRPTERELRVTNTGEWAAVYWGEGGREGGSVTGEASRSTHSSLPCTTPTTPSLLPYFDNNNNGNARQGAARLCDRPQPPDAPRHRAGEPRGRPRRRRRARRRQAARQPRRARPPHGARRRARRAL